MDRLYVVNHHASDGIAIGECWLYDEKGPIGTSTVAALAQRKPMTACRRRETGKNYSRRSGIRRAFASASIIADTVQPASSSLEIEFDAVI